MSKIGIILNGVIKENPVFVLMLGMCPTLATTTSAMNGMMMGLATMAVLIFSNIIISLIKNLTPDMVHIPVYIVVIATLVTIVQFSLAAYMPDVNKSLGLFIPLIVVNCVILGRAEAFASKNDVLSSAVDGIGIGLGFTLGLTVLGICRELLGNGTIFGLTILPADYSMLIFILPPGAFLTLGYIIAIINRFKKA
ncbi:MAG: electron transport complex subunit E [Prevotella sp.]|jgi:electron transport complex protein RnfE|nr:electron transport complex subunit E [Prevotella sp.]